MRSSTREQVERAPMREKGDTRKKVEQLTLRPDREAERMAGQAEGRFQKKTGEIRRDFGR